MAHEIDPERKPRTWAVALFAAYLGVVFYLTLIWHTELRPHPGESLKLIPFRMVALYWRKGGWELLLNVVGNLTVFMPLGVLLPAIRAGRTTVWRSAAVGFALSLGIETLQYCSGRRVADIDDVWLNTLGMVPGHAAFRIASGLLRRDRV